MVPSAPPAVNSGSTLSDTPPAEEEEKEEEEDEEEEVEEDEEEDEEEEDEEDDEGSGASAIRVATTVNASHSPDHVRAMKAANVVPPTPATVAAPPPPFAACSSSTRRNAWVKPHPNARASFAPAAPHRKSSGPKPLPPSHDLDSPIPPAPRPMPPTPSIPEEAAQAAEEVLVSTQESRLWWGSRFHTDRNPTDEAYLNMER